MIKTKKNKKLRISLILCSLLICICSILCLVPFNNDRIVVKADTTTSVYEFVGSDIYIPNMGYTVENYPKFSLMTDYFDYSTRLSISLDYTDSSDLINIKFKLNSFSNNYNSRKQVTWAGNDSSADNIIELSMNHIDYDNVYYTGKYGFRSFSLQSYGGNITGKSLLFVEMYYFGTSDVSFSEEGIPLGDVVSIEIGNYSKKNPTVLPYLGNSSFGTDFQDVSPGYYNYVSYIFSADYRLNVLIPTTYNTKNSYSYYPYSYFQTRTYNVPNTNSNEYQNGYNAGYSTGYNNGNIFGYDQGYDEGYNLGNNLGYNNGFSEGVESANDYTFLSLISATIDAPVKYFQSLFNFELLGVNLQGFLTGLFTLCVIVTIVKLCLGG